MSARVAGIALLAAVALAVVLLVAFALTRERAPQPWDPYKTSPGAATQLQVAGERLA